MATSFHSYAMWPHKTAFKNVAFGLKWRRRPQAKIKERVHRRLDLVRLGE